MKKFLVSLLLICGVALPCFSSAYYVENFVGNNLSLNGGQTASNLYTNDSQYYGKTTFCMINRNDPVCNFTATSTFDGQSVTINTARQIGCLTGITLNSQYGINIQNNSSSYCQAMGAILLNGQLLYPQYTSLQCQTEYNLIPISSVDQNYCTTNNLCPTVDCPEYPDNPNLGTSNLYINDVFHPGAFNVIVNIPEEIDWDYAYTNSGSNFNLDIVGYNQDFELIEDWVATNNYKPTSDDFTNTFLLFKDYSGLLIALLFIILVFYFVKKLF